MRIVVGLLVLYVHLAYCFDLTAFFGANAWMDQKSANKQREELPFALNHWNWDDYKPRLNLPQLNYRRTVVFDFLRHLPSNKTDRDKALGFLKFNIAKRGLETFNQILERDFVSSLQFLDNAAKMTPESRGEAAALMANASFVVKEPLMPGGTPSYFVQMSPAERVEIWRQCLEILPYLPDSKAGANLNIIFDWLREISVQDRNDLMKYLKELPEGAEGLKTLDYYEHWHMDPRDAYVLGRTTFSIWFHVSDPTTMWVCHILILIVIVLFTIGFATRITSVMTWLAALFYIHRNGSILFGMDTMMNVLLFYIMTGPSGAALSVDRMIARYRAARAIFKAGGQPVPWAEAVLAGPRQSSMANFTIRLIQIHFCFIYMASGLAKLKGQTWWNTTAAWYIIANPEFTPLQYAAYESLLRAYSKSKLLLEILFGMMTYFTLFVEISLPFLIWTRARPYIVCLAIMLHFGIGWVMGLTCFALLMFAFLLSYMPASVIRERMTWAPGSGPKLTLHYSSHNPRHGKVVAFLRAFDLAGQISFRDDWSKKPDDDSHVQLVDENHRIATGDEIISCSMRKLLLLRWIVYIPGVEYLVRRLVDVPPCDELSPKRMDYGQPALQPKSKP
jgi:hypothetical protein